MSKKSDIQYLGDMLDYAREALNLIANRARPEYDNDRALQLALSHAIMIIGEAASRVSASTRDASPEIEWSRISGMRNRLVHDYGNVDRGIVWDSTIEDVPPLITALEKIMSRS